MADNQELWWTMNNYKLIDVNLCTNIILINSPTISVKRRNIKTGILDSDKGIW